jgi:isocitrate/isopropylmalate dehydrogenase
MSIPLVGQQQRHQQPSPLLSPAAAAAASAASPSAAPFNSPTRGLMTYMPSPGDARPHTVTLIPGDGIGPEVTSAVIAVVEALKAPVVWERFDSLSGATADGAPPTAVPQEVLDSIRRNGVCLKGTLFTPLSKKNTSTQSLNVQLRKDLDLVVNLVRFFRFFLLASLAPGDNVGRRRRATTIAPPFRPQISSFLTREKTPG